MKFNGKDTTLQEGDIICYDKAAYSITITRSGQRMEFPRGESIPDNKMYFECTSEKAFTQVVMILAQTHGLGIKNVGIKRHEVSGNPFFTFVKRAQ